MATSQANTASRLASLATSLCEPIFAAAYDATMSRAESIAFAGIRRDLLHEIPESADRVLEVGAGTGVNLRHYPEHVTRLDLVEPAPSMADRIPVDDRPGTTVHLSPAEDVPFEDNTFDVAVSTLVLCSVRDLSRSLLELRRVLRPGGRFLFFEHVLASDVSTARWQHRLKRPWRTMAAGCNLNRDTAAAIEDAGFTVIVREDRRVPMPRLVSEITTGIAEA